MEGAMGIEDVFKGGNIVTGLAIGIGAAVIAPAIRPLAKSLMKAGLVAYDQGRAVISDLNERTSDVVAEARAELAGAGHQTAAGRAAAASGAAAEDGTDRAEETPGPDDSGGGRRRKTPVRQ
jgi:uncharacterized protein DUF5132